MSAGERRLAQPTAEPLRARAYRGEQGECALCGGPIGHHDWCVTVPRADGRRRGDVAHTHCASDAGWGIE